MDATPVDRDVNNELTIPQVNEYLQQTKRCTTMPPSKPCAGDVYLFEVRDDSGFRKGNFHIP